MTFLGHKSALSLIVQNPYNQSLILQMQSGSLVCIKALPWADPSPLGSQPPLPPVLLTSALANYFSPSKVTLQVQETG